MIDKETLKKHNLKAIPFECVGEGETFLDFNGILGHQGELTFWERRLVGSSIEFADGGPSGFRASHYRNTTVYVPVWRTTAKNKRI